MNIKLLFIISILCVTSVSAFDWDAYYAAKNGNAAVSDKIVATIDDCYNVSLRVRQTSGDDYDPSFKDCVNDGDGYWHCDCHTTLGEYPLTMRTDNAAVDDDRRYTISITYYQYDLEKSKNTVDVRDWGDGFDTDGGDIENLGKDVIIVEKEVNNTVYVDKIVDKPVYVDRVKEVPFEDKTKITALQQNITQLEDDIARKNSSRFWLNLFFYASILLNGFFIYMWVKGR